MLLRLPCRRFSRLAPSAARHAFNQPLGGNEMPRFSGTASFMRLPPAQATPTPIHAGIVGIGLDIGTSNRSGTRYGPREIRNESVLIRPYNMATRDAPFDSLQIADFGDVPINPYNLKTSIDIIERFYRQSLLLPHPGIVPVTLGGDHTVTLPILRAIVKCNNNEPVALIHVDAHSDTNDTMRGEKVCHGTPFRRALEENLIIGSKTFQIGLRGSGYSAEDFDWGRSQGFHVYPAHELWNKSLAPLMEEIRAKIGTTKVYLSFDIDGLDPAFAPGTGTPEVGGLSIYQGLEIVRGTKGTALIGCDLVEVSPPYDASGNTALTGANLVFEMLCALPGVKSRK